MFVLIAFSSCSDDSNPSAPPGPVTGDLFPLDSNYAPGARTMVVIYLMDSLHVGYNPVYIVLRDSVTGATITDAHIEFSIVNHGHNVPVENPPSLAVDGKFKGAWILNAPQSGDAPHYHYHIHVHNHQSSGEPEGEVEFGDFVVKDETDKFKSIVMPDSSKLYLSYIAPRNPVTGLNEFEFLINKNEPELFPPDGSYTIEMVPTHSDGHTTNNNVNPAGREDGHYLGTVNLDRSGAWKIKLKVIKESISYDTYFDLTY